MIKLFCTALVTALLATPAFCQHHLTKLWTTDTSFKVPESVLVDPASRILFVSNIEGKADGKDDKGSIGQLDASGKIRKVDWVAGLQAPKGMGLYHNMLYVADLDAIGIIDVKKGILLKRIPVAGAVFLNDLTIDEHGIVFFSDSRAGKVYRMEGEKVSLLLDGLKNPNGLLSVGNDFYLVDSGVLYLMGAGKSLKKIVEGMEPDTDGIVHVKGKEFIVSCWGGSVYYINSDASKQKLLDTREEKSNTADIGYDAATKVLYVPTFNKNSVVAYKVE